MTDAPRILVKDSSGWSGVWRDVHMEEWTAPGSVALVRARFAAQKQWLDAFDPNRKVITFSIVATSSLRPLEGEMKDVINEGVRYSTPRVKAAAIIVNAEGFKAAVFRSILATLLYFSNAKYPNKSFTGVDEAITWVADLLDDHGGRKPSVDDAAAALRTLRAAGNAP